MGLVCKKEATHGQFRKINIQILNIWKITPRPDLWHFKHLKLPSLLIVLSIAEEIHTRGITISYLYSGGVFGNLFVFFFCSGWGNNSEPKWLSISTVLLCTMCQCVCNLSTSGTKIQLQRRVNLDMLFRHTYFLHLKIIAVYICLDPKNYQETYFSPEVTTDKMFTYLILFEEREKIYFSHLIAS